MAQNVTLYNLLISCPGDIKKEVTLIEAAVDEFNELYAETLGITIKTRHWSKSSYAQSGGKPQALLNEQFVNKRDAAVAIFWTRFGSPTDEYGSGTEEEIEIEISDASEIIEIRTVITEMMKKYTIPNKTIEIYYKNKPNDKEFCDINTLKNEVIFFNNGQIGFDEKGKFLFDLFDSMFRDIAYELGAIEKLYPVLLPLDEYSMTGFVRKTPQYAIFCSTVNENLRDLERTDAAMHDKKVKEIIIYLCHRWSKKSGCIVLNMDIRSMHNDLLIFISQKDGWSEKTK